MNKRYVHVLQCLLVQLLALLALGGGMASATPNVAWFPYANCDNWQFSGGQVTGVCPCWGDRYSGMYMQIDSGSDNLIWTKEHVFSNYSICSESWYDIADTEYTFIVSLHNPTNAAISLQISIFDNFGTQMDQNSQWGDNTTYLIKQGAQSNITWNNTYHWFTLSLGAGKTVNIPCFDGGTDNFFNMPPAAASNNFHANIRVVAPSGEDFMASIRSWDFGRYRTNGGNYTSSFSTEKVAILQSGYPAIYTSTYSAGDHTLTLPIFRETYDPPSSSIEWSTMVKVVNADDNVDNITVDVYDLTGSLIKSHPFNSVPAHGGFSFSPSQFFTSIYQGQGYLVISGTKPAAVAFNYRFPKSSVTYYGQSSGTMGYFNPRITAMQASELFLD